MPLLKQQFKIDLFNLKYAKDPEAIRESHKNHNARELGMKLIEQFPYTIVEKFEGELPHAVMTRDHQFTETWGVELVVLTREQWEQIEKIIGVGIDKARVLKILEG